MGILDRLRANKQPETRSDDSYTAAVSKGLALAAVGAGDAQAERTAAAEFCVGLLGRCLAVADVEPESLALTLTPSLRDALARRLYLTGNATYEIDVNRLGNIGLVPAVDFTITGGVRESTWRYLLNIPAPTEPEIRNRPSESVVHVRIGANPWAHWYGISPLENAGLSTAILAKMEHRMSQEAAARVGYVLPMPDGISDDSVDALKADLAALNGNIALVESTSAGHGQGRTAAPQADWRLQRLGAEFPEGNVNLRRQVGGDVCAAMGVPASLYVGADGGTVREAYRQLLVATLQPLAQIIAEEIERKLETPVKFDFRRLAAADIAARARAYGSLVGAGMDETKAQVLAGLTE